MEQQDRIMDGDLQTLGLQSILKMLALSGKTGKLFVSSGPETLSISLRKGQIVGLHEDGVPQPDILGMLCLINKLDPPRAQMVRELSQGDMQMALAMLVERGWMSAAEMQRRLEFAVTQSISHALRWVNGRFAFHRQLLPMESKLQPLDVDSMLLEALRQADEWEEIAREGVTHLTRTTVARWQPEVSDDVRRLGLNQESIEVLCLANGELTLQAVSLVLMMPEARVAALLARLLELHLIEVVDTALETELQQDLSNIIIKCQYTLAQQRQTSQPDQHLLGLITTLAECINNLLIHHGSYARHLRGRGHIPSMEIVRYLERRFLPHLQMLAKQQFPILETATFHYGQLDCNDILTLHKLVKGEQLEEFYWEAVQGLVAFLRMIFTELLRDEVGNSHTGRQLTVAWKIFLSEIDHEVQQYQVYRAHRNAQMARGHDQSASPSIGIVQNWNGSSEPPNGDFWSHERRRSM
ncbi:DUF4388 domain-containing protein [Tengunoibacter tsumagoiensis]|uniref:PatA-like N-terminal domain-containing protein n=1 Tax=Tengunoibacter tsumagoiensis TaxID=2014871 RepID=A0A401ZYC4_9CHLR|nr:DUF4388 domain-containing protein [Tengunoibacter tsumagoiensis]GCE11856.1 hypothetical protein KTT_17150 [Tengunoibacter tsumagoiensis]